MSYMFGLCNNLELSYLNNIDTSLVTDLSYMFYFSKMKIIDTSNFYTKNLIDMSLMFSNNENLESLDLSNFNTEQVENMQSMFSL